MQVNIIIDGEQFVIAPRKLEHLIEFLNIVRMQYQSQFRVIKTLYVNGRQVQEITEEFLKLLWSPSGMITIQMDTIQQQRNVYDVMEEVNLYLTKLIYGINMCAEYFHLESEDLAESYWTYSLQGIDWVLKRLKEIEFQLQLKTYEPVAGFKTNWQKMYDEIAESIKQSFDFYHAKDFKKMGNTLENELSTSLRSCQAVLNTLYKSKAA